VLSDKPLHGDTWLKDYVRSYSCKEILPEFKTTFVEDVLSKGRYTAAYSGFEGTADKDGSSLADWLHARDIDEVDVVGIATDHCVRATALDAMGEGIRARVLLGLTAGVARPTVDAALGQLREAGVVLEGEPVVS